MAEESKETVFGEIIKGPDTKVVVSLSTFNNKNYLNVREYWRPENKDFLPTKKGITLPTDEQDMVDDLIAILQKAKEYLEKS